MDGLEYPAEVESIYLLTVSMLQLVAHRAPGWGSPGEFKEFLKELCIVLASISVVYLF